MYDKKKLLDVVRLIKKSWVRISLEAAYFYLKKGKWVVAGVVVLCCLPSVLFKLFQNSCACTVHIYKYYIFLTLDRRFKELMSSQNQEIIFSLARLIYVAFSFVL